MSGAESGNQHQTVDTLAPAHSQRENLGTIDSPAILAGLRLLQQACIYSAELERTAWDFAVDIASLRSVGLHFNDLRWLIFQGYAEHARELTRLADTNRSFGPVGTSLLTRRACFVLTPAGSQFAEGMLQSGANALSFPSNLAAQNGCGMSAPRTNGMIPRWDCDLREFRFAGQLVKQYKLPSPNQEAILMTFEEEGWKCRIDDPLPSHPQFEPKQRLHDTIRSLNRNQKAKLIRFKGDGTGEGILWEPASNSNGSNSNPPNGEL